MHIDGNNITAMWEHLTSAETLIKEISGESLFVIDFIHSIKTAMLCLKNSDADHVSEKVHSILIGMLKVT